MLKFKVHDNFTEPVVHALAKASTQAEQVVAIQIAKDTSPYVPMRTGSLNIRTKVDGGNIIYPGPYARYLYYGKVMEGPKAGPKHATDKDLVYTKDHHPDAQSFWFEASKAQNLEKWVRVADKAVSHYLKRK